METAPRSFTESLKTQFGGRLRIRWSPKQQQWQIEEKIARSTGDMPQDSYNDEATRLRDGYALVCTVTPGDRMPCPKCRTTLYVPVFHFGMVKCDYCAVQGRNTNIIAGHFPLNDSLLEHLRRLDPIRAYRDDFIYPEYNEWIEKKIDQKVEDLTPIWSDHYRRLVGIPMVGYSKA